MGKIKLKVSDRFILGTLIVLFGIAGCSDMPYTGSMLSVPEVDRYLVSTDGNAVCFQGDLNATCKKIGPGTQNGAAATNGPAIHIYPEKSLYLFYHEGTPILRAERTDGQDGNNDTNNGSPANNDNSDNNNDNPANDGTNPGDNTANTNHNDSDGHGWIIWVYYPDGAIPKDTPVLSQSGVTVTVNGKQLTDKDITGFAQFIGPNNEKGVQFFYPTKSAELLDLKVRMEGIVDTEDTVRFNINYLWKSR